MRGVLLGRARSGGNREQLAASCRLQGRQSHDTTDGGPTAARAFSTIVDHKYQIGPSLRRGLWRCPVGRNNLFPLPPLNGMLPSSRRKIFCSFIGTLKSVGKRNQLQSSAPDCI